MRNADATEMVEMASKLRHKVIDLFREEMNSKISQPSDLSYFIQALHMYLVFDLLRMINPSHKKRWLRHFMKDNEQLLILQFYNSRNI